MNLYDDDDDRYAADGKLVSGRLSAGCVSYKLECQDPSRLGSVNALGSRIGKESRYPICVVLTMDQWIMHAFTLV